MKTRFIGLDLSTKTGLVIIDESGNEFCPTCNGSGGIDTFEESIGEIVTITCPDCGGSGVSY